MDLISLTSPILFLQSMPLTFCAQFAIIYTTVNCHRYLIIFIIVCKLILYFLEIFALLLSLNLSFLRSIICLTIIFSLYQRKYRLKRKTSLLGFH